MTPAIKSSNLSRLLTRNCAWKLDLSDKWSVKFTKMFFRVTQEAVMEERSRDNGLSRRNPNVRDRALRPRNSSLCINRFSKHKRSASVATGEMDTAGHRSCDASDAVLLVFAKLRSDSGNHGWNSGICISFQAADLDQADSANWFIVA